MEIEQVQIHNYRSIRDMEFTATELMILLGPNNHGKSNILGALEFALSPSAKPSEDDLCAFCGQEDRALWVELSFANLTEQEQRTFQEYLRSDGSVRIRKTTTFDDAGGIETGYRGYFHQPELWWLQRSAFDRLGSRDAIEAEAEHVPELGGLLEKSGRIIKRDLSEFQATYVKGHREELEFDDTLETGPLLGAKNVAAGILPDFYLVPAVRDLSDETKIRTSTTFGRLLQRAINDMAQRDPRFTELRERMSDLVKELNARPEAGDEEVNSIAQLEKAITENLQDWGVSVAIEVIPPEIEKIFELGTELHLDDGHKTRAELKGHGLQRATIFALLRAWAQALQSPPDDQTVTSRKASESVVFAIEEPELFLHPHAQRQLAQVLQDIAASAGYQVFVCSHSTHFVNLDQHKSIAIVSRNSPQEGTTVRQCCQDLFEGEGAKDKKDRFHMAAWINPDRGEMFFAHKVIFVEGETEKTILPFLSTLLGCFDPNVSIIDCGSKYNLPLYIAIANAFNLNFTVVHDEDPPDDTKKAKKRTYELNTIIEMEVDKALGDVQIFCPDFETVSGVSHSQGDKKGKALAALDHFATSTVQEIPKELAEIVRNGYISRDTGPQEAEAK